MRPAVLICLCAYAAAQSFEAASVKPAAIPPGARIQSSHRGGPGTRDPGLVAFHQSTLLDIVVVAWGLPRYQISTPAWFDTERYDLTARIPEGITREQFRIMLQNLLAERFDMTVHRETKEIHGYELTLNRGGSKLKESHPAEGERPGIAAAQRLGPAGRIVVLTAKSASLGALLSGYILPRMNGPVTDNTGLNGSYEFTLEFSPDGDDNIDNPAPALPTALREQLGLKLEPKKVAVEMLIVDRAARVPLGN